jgi:hypothetical protein
MHISDAVREEWVRTFRTPYFLIANLTVNFVLMSGAWFLLPRDWFFNYTNPVDYPLALAAWLYADTPATNVLGQDCERMLAALQMEDDGHRSKQLHVLLRGRNIVHWVLVTVPCWGLALIGLHKHVAFSITMIIAIAIVPLGALSLSNAIGFWWPFHLRSLKWRLAEFRRNRRNTIRWLILLVLPYGVVPALTGVVIVPVALIWRFAYHDVPIRDMSAGDAVFLTLVLAFIAIAMWRIGYWLCKRLARTRRGSLIDYLSDPDRG